MALIIDAEETEIVVSILNHVNATLEHDPKTDVYWSNDALLIVLDKEQYKLFTKAMNKLNK